MIRRYRSPRSSFGEWVRVRLGARIVPVWRWDTLGQLRFAVRVGELQARVAAGYRWQRRWGWLVWLAFALFVGALVFAVVGGVVRASRQPAAFGQFRTAASYEAWLDRVEGAQW